MGRGYADIKSYESSLHTHISEHFSERLSLFDEIMEVYLEPLDEVCGYWHYKEEKSPTILLLARMFNDFESAKLLLLHGQPEQAMMPTRDIIESMMLLRLFGSDSKLALRWMKDLKEYHPAKVKERLGELKILCPEHAFYQSLSQLAHVNLLSVAHRATEKKQSSNLIVQSYHFGGINNPTWIRLLRDKLLEIGADFQLAEDTPEGEDKIERDRVFKKLGIEKIRLALFNMEEIVSDKGFPSIDS